VAREEGNVAIELSSKEKMVAGLLARAAADSGAPEPERISSALRAADAIKKYGYVVVDLKDYDAGWQELVDAAKAAKSTHAGEDFEHLQRELSAARRDLKAVEALAQTAQSKEAEARRQISECQKIVKELKARPSSDDHLVRHAGALQRELETAKQNLHEARQEARRWSDAAKKSQNAEVEVKRQVEACSSLVARLTQKQPAALVQKPSVAFQKAAPSLSFTVGIGLLTGGITAIVGGVIMKKLLEPSANPKKAAKT
jgi:5-bromo-4-chloroindolyl phosphate hydrolysis protein